MCNGGDSQGRGVFILGTAQMRAHRVVVSDVMVEEVIKKSSHQVEDGRRMEAWSHVRGTFLLHY